MEPPFIEITSRDQAHSPSFQNDLSVNCITLIRGFCPNLDLKCHVFQSDALVKQAPNFAVDLRIQNSSQQSKGSWGITSKQDETTLKEYEKYRKGFDMNKTNHPIQFATNIDLIDVDLWKPQLLELEKVPEFLIPNGINELMSFIGGFVLGMNSFQIYVKVPGSRTPGHQENSILCSFNINMGPGEVEWYATQPEQWNNLEAICSKKKVDYVKGAWWPHLEDLMKAGIPYYRFVQKPGEAVYVNIGTPHWVQALGSTTNVAWNFGPLTTRQYSGAIERAAWNRIRSYATIVPIIHISWELAKKLRSTDKSLVIKIKEFLSGWLFTFNWELSSIKTAGLPILEIEQLTWDYSHTCSRCNHELYGLLLRRESNFCFQCFAKTRDQTGFECVCLRDPKALQTILENFEVSSVIEPSPNFQDALEDPSHIDVHEPATPSQNVPKVPKVSSVKISISPRYRKSKMKGKDVTKGKSYQCPLCPKTYSSFQGRRDHIREIHECIRPKCPFCFKQMRKQYSIKRHIKRIHQDKVVPQQYL